MTSKVAVIRGSVAGRRPVMVSISADKSSASVPAYWAKARAFGFQPSPRIVSAVSSRALRQSATRDGSSITLTTSARAMARSRATQHMTFV